jgi:hypothetical protein
VHASTGIGFVVLTPGQYSPKMKLCFAHISIDGFGAFGGLPAIAPAA